MKPINRRNFQLASRRHSQTGTMIWWFRFWIIPERPFPVRWIRVMQALGTRLERVELHRGRNVRLPKIYMIRHHLGTRLDSVYTNAVSWFSMRLRLLFTRHRSTPLAKPGRFENAGKCGAFSKWYGFIFRVSGETTVNIFCSIVNVFKA